MPEPRAFGSMDPNSEHQLWSEWIFKIDDAGKHPPFNDVFDNVRRWLRTGFGSVGRMRLEEGLSGWRIVAQFEGVAAHDPDYVASVRKQFQKIFVEKGWGPFASSSVRVKILSGDLQDGKPASQLVVMPTIRLNRL